MTPSEALSRLASYARGLAVAVVYGILLTGLLAVLVAVVA